MAEIARRKKLCLIGCMGSGKSSLARRYAAKYGGSVIDTDAEFIRRYGAIDDFFAKYGESEFRKREAELLAEVALSDAAVIATGGGAVLSKSGMNALRANCDIAYLTAPVEILRDRIKNSSRPLKNDIENIMRVRAPLYERYADYTVDSSVDSLSALEAELKKPRKNRFDIVLCDSDDTLLDFQAASRYAISEVVKKLNIPRDADEAYAAYSRITDELWRKMELGEITHEQRDRLRAEMLSSELGIELSPQEFNGVYISAMSATRFTLNGATQFLDDLSARGIKSYIITNSPMRMARERLTPLMPHVKGAFISDEIGEDKPSVKFFDAVFAAIEAPDKDRVIVFGDGEGSDIKGAASYGLTSCLFDPSGKKPTAADFGVKSYAEFLELI